MSPLGRWWPAIRRERFARGPCRTPRSTLVAKLLPFLDRRTHMTAFARFLMKAHFVLQAPIAIFFILCSARIAPEYRLSWWRRYALGFRMFWNRLWIQSGSSY